MERPEAKTTPSLAWPGPGPALAPRHKQASKQAGQQRDRPGFTASKEETTPPLLAEHLHLHLSPAARPFTVRTRTHTHHTPLTPSFSSHLRGRRTPVLVLSCRLGERARIRSDRHCRGHCGLLAPLPFPSGRAPKPRALKAAPQGKQDHKPHALGSRRQTPADARKWAQSHTPSASPYVLPPARPSLLPLLHPILGIPGPAWPWHAWDGVAG
jgi:hypothetical protein